MFNKDTETNDRFWSVGSGDNCDPNELLNAVHLIQEASKNTFMGISCVSVGASRCSESVNLVLKLFSKRIVGWLSSLTKNIIDGEAARAFLNISLTARSDSPTNLFSSCIRRKMNDGHIKRSKRHYFWSFDSYKVNPTLTRTSSSQNRLTATWRPIQ